jgi:DNA polymerase III subunit beta
MPILSQVAVDALEDGTLRISASDLNTSIITESQCTVKQPGSACITAGKLQEIVRLASDGIIKINLLDNDWVSVITETSKFKLPCSKREEFPELAAMQSSSLISVPSDILALLITRASIAMATTDEGRFALQSLKFTIGEDGAQMVGTDGDRLAIAKVALAEEPLDELHTLVPRAALAELIRLTGEYNGAITINADENHIFFRLGKRLLISTMVTGEYPNHELLLPKAIQDSVEFNTERLALGIRRAALMAHKTSHTIKLAFGDSKLQLSAQTSEHGEAVESVDSDNALALTTAFNYQFLLDFLEVVGSEKVVLDLSGAEIQAQMQPVGEADEAYRYVLMPMRVKAKEEVAE